MRSAATASPFASRSGSGHCRASGPSRSAIAMNVANCVSCGSSRATNAAYARPRAVRAVALVRHEGAVQRLEQRRAQRHDAPVVEHVRAAQLGELAPGTAGDAIRARAHASCASSGTVSTAMYSGLRKSRVIGLYGLTSSPSLRSACSGFTPTNAPPACAVHSASVERSPRSPAPQFRALRTV